MMWDVFISHASEDKDKLVRPLAKQLKEIYKVNVWYDEFTLEYGDSLLDSIERGLQNSRFGVVIFSPNFLKKVWTDHEFKSLKTKEMLLNKKVIIPVWYDVNKDEIAKYSLTLADKVALTVDNNFNINEIAIKIIKIIRPDIYYNISRMQIYGKLLKSSNKVWLSIDEMKNIPKPPIRHENISTFIKSRLKLVYNAIKDVDGRSYKEYEEDFRRNTNIDREIIITELITAAYVDYINLKKFTSDEKLYIYIITVALGEVENLEIPLDENVIDECAKVTKEYLKGVDDANITMEFKFK
ncbi:toll/interleukin-1 receptor domain-containing protein [Clostridium sp. WLY-B-L2]|uniref:Toll/interleukin-1 receptor domain-containing protein n=1 Tax=Clostridium aromativorans TaxID=2836848 RepID=A0ABS8N825_9CLOT|nr:toll/interleukin-1 receptor domain-containing protein [Clostridium aromativorans]MCC9295960.1 toll/interleukin-1 receptor domain-containing protein [Clostridium aromativorans]